MFGDKPSLGTANCVDKNKGKGDTEKFEEQLLDQDKSLEPCGGPEKPKRQQTLKRDWLCQAEYSRTVAPC